MHRFPTEESKQDGGKSLFIVEEKSVKNVLPLSIYMREEK